METGGHWLEIGGFMPKDRVGFRFTCSFNPIENEYNNPPHEIAGLVA